MLAGIAAAVVVRLAVAAAVAGSFQLLLLHSMQLQLYLLLPSVRSYTAVLLLPSNSLIQKDPWPESLTGPYYYGYLQSKMSQAYQAHMIPQEILEYPRTKPQLTPECQSEPGLSPKPSRPKIYTPTSQKR